MTDEIKTDGETAASAAPVLDMAGIAASGVRGKLNKFKGGIGTSPSDIVQAEHVLADMTISVNVPCVNGKPIGTWRNGALWVPMAQLRLAPAEDLLCSLYQPGDADPEFERRLEAMKALGEGVPALPIALSNQAIVIRGDEVPLFLVLDRPEIYHALLALRESEAKVEFIQSPRKGSVLLRSLSDRGPLRVDPSILETCRAVKRLRELGFTFPEIASHMARNSEDHTRPSESTLHTYVDVASLPEALQEKLHRGVILWTHAKSIAGKFLGDDVICVRLGMLASQGSQITTRDLDKVIARIENNFSTLAEENGVIVEIPNGGLHLMPPPPPAPKGAEVNTYQGTMGVKPILIQQAAANYRIKVVAAERAVAPTSLDGIKGYLNAIRSNTPIAEIEVQCLGFLQAIREEGQRQGIVNAQGIVAQVIDQHQDKASQ